jgi:hypothetical protein
MIVVFKSCIPKIEHSWCTNLGIQGESRSLYVNVHSVMSTVVEIVQMYSVRMFTMIMRCDDI